MATRTGLDLLPDQCRIVDVFVRHGRDAPSSDIRVRSFELLPAGSDSVELPAALAQLRRQRRLSTPAWVTLWGLRSVHQYLKLPPAREADLEALALREARRDLAPLEAEGGPLCAAVTAGPEVQVGTHRRREVSLVAVAESEVRRRVQAITDAGFAVQGVFTPAMALASLARQARGAMPGATAAYVALESRATCVAIVRDGVLLFSREIPWGFGDTTEAVETRLAAELRRSMLFFRQTFRTPVDGVVLCGGMANLRSLTAPVGAALSVPVETLDSLVGVDAASVPEPADLFRAAVGSLRLALAPAAEAAASAGAAAVRSHLLPASIRAARERRAEIGRVAAACAAGVLIVAAWYALTRGPGADPSAEIAAIERRVALLEPEAERLAGIRSTSAAASLQQAALAAFDSQGPRLARLLETLSTTTPPEVVLSEIDARAEGAHWRTIVRGLAISTDPAVGQSAVAGVIRRLAGSEFAGPVAQPPTFRVMSGRDPVDSEAATTAVAIPDGMSGVEFSVQLRVRK
jgi:hypothetical protein